MIDALVRAFAAAVQDVRHKVVEEGFFGRETTPSAAREPADSRSALERWGWEKAVEPPGIHQAAPAPDHGIDR